MKKDLSVLIKRIKAKTGLTQDEIGKRINYGHSQFAVLKKNNDQDVYTMLENEFKKELEIVDAESLDTAENLLTLSASVKMLYEEVAILKAKSEGITPESSIQSMKARTKIIISGLV